MKYNKKQLIERWKTEKGKLLKDDILDSLKNNIELKYLKNIELINKYYDLRGIELPHKFLISNNKLENINFTYANLDNVILEKVEVTNVFFDLANCLGMLNYECIFKDCRFNKTNLKGAGLGIKRTKYLNTNFIKCNLTGASYHTPYFENVSFEGCKFGKTDFGSSHFVNVIFTGKLINVRFRGKYDLLDGKKLDLNPMLIDFSEAELWWPTFSDNCDLSNVILPNDGNHFLINNFNKVILQLDKLIKKEFTDEDFRKEAKIFAEIYYSENKTMYIFNIKDLESRSIKEFGEERGKEYTDKLIYLLKKLSNNN